MGGEAPAEKILEAFSRKAKKEPLSLCFFGLAKQKKVFENLFESSSNGKDFFQFVTCKEVIRMEDLPLEAIRKKKEASICVALRFLKQGKIGALISATNTGALIAKAKHELSLFPGIFRPALVTFLPTKKKPLAVLDVGANISVNGKTLEQFAKMGTLLQKAFGVLKPKVAFLNIGKEPFKGLLELKKAFATLKEETFFSFLGNREGDTVFKGDIDVLVTDGFTGNIFLKTAEGVARFLLDSMQKTFPSDLAKSLQEKLCYSPYPGAFLLGCSKVVFKCHGNCPAENFVKAAETLHLSQGKGIFKKLEEFFLKSPPLFCRKTSKDNLG